MQKSIKRIVRRLGSATLTMASALVMTISCGTAKQQATTSSVQIAEAQSASHRYFAGTLDSFAKLTYVTGGNHPDYYTAACDGKLLTTDYVGVYGTTRIHLELNPVSGEIASTAQYSGPIGPTSLKLLPPDQGGDYFAYVNALSSMQEALRLVAAAQALDFVKAAEQQVKALTKIDAVRLVSWASMNLLGRPTSVTVAFKAQEGRLLVLSLCDKTKCYTEQKTPLTEAEGSLNLTVMIPAQVSDPDSANIKVQLVTEGAEQSTVLKEEMKSVILQKFEMVSSYAAYSMRAGTHQSAYILFRTAAPAAFVSLKIFDSSGVLVASASGSLTGSTGDNTSNFTLPFDLSASAAAGDAKVVVRVYTADGSWDNFLSESVTISKITP